MVGARGASRDDAHEGHECLAGGQLPLLDVGGLLGGVRLEHGPDAVARGNIGLGHGPVTEVLRDLKENRLK